LKSLPETEGLEEAKREFLDYQKNLKREEIETVSKHTEELNYIDFNWDNDTKSLKLVMRNTKDSWINILIEVKNGEYEIEEKFLECEDDIEYVRNFIFNT
jgi:hypothetical protein